MMCEKRDLARREGGEQRRYVFGSEHSIFSIVIMANIC